MKFSRDQRAAFFRGEAPRIALEADSCPVEVGEVHPLSSKLRVTVTGTTRNKKGEWIVHYRITDDRPRLVRRTPPASDEGHPVRREDESDDQYEQRLRQHIERSRREPTGEEIAKARHDGSYTSSDHDALDAGEAPSDAEMNEMTKKAHLRFAEHQESERAEETARQDLQRVQARMRATIRQAIRTPGVNPTDVLARWERDLAQLEEQMKEAA